MHDESFYCGSVTDTYQAGSSDGTTANRHSTRKAVESIRLDRGTRQNCQRVRYSAVLKVKEIGDKALAAYNAQDCRAALPLLEQYGKQANAMANLLRSGLEPYY